MTLYNLLLIASIIVLVVVLINIIKNNMKIGYAMIWIIWGLSMILISLFPDIVIWLSSLLGISIASNTVFLISIFLLYCLTFYIYLKISKHNDEIVNLNYEIAVLKKRIEDFENKKII